MNTVHALIVGIDRYRPPVRRLRGCGNDVRAMADYLTTHLAEDRRQVLVLRDEEATRDAVIDGFRRHLARAVRGDTALFWFSGHGSQVPEPDPRPRSNSTGMAYTLLCVDSRHDDVPDLLDRELAVLIDEVAARGAHVAVVLDCCYSDGVARDEQPDSGIRAQPPLHTAPAMDRLLAELRSGATGSRGAVPVAPDANPHVVLAACHVNEVARERRLSGMHHGVFSFGLLQRLARPGPVPTYRDLVTGARRYVEDLVGEQQPMLRPANAALADQPFLGGRVAPSLSAVVLRQVRGGWEVNVGSCHGVLPGTDAEPTTFGVLGTDRIREVRVSRVLTERSAVVPIGWSPDGAAQYPVALTATPNPTTTVLIGTDDADDPATVSLLRAALATTAPSPLVRTVRDGPADLRVNCPRPGSVVVTAGPDEPPVPARQDITTPADVRLVVADLEHVARWRRTRYLRNPVSCLDGAVLVEIVPTSPNSEPLRADGSGCVHVRYQQAAGGDWLPPQVFLRMHNRGPQPLFCALLDLTDRYQIHADLLAGEWVEPGCRTWIADGEPIELALPSGRPVRSGATCRDWLLLVTGQRPFDTSPYELGPLGEPTPAGRAAPHRGERRAAYDWATAVVPVLTSVP